MGRGLEERGKYKTRRELGEPRGPTIITDGALVSGSITPSWMECGMLHPIALLDFSNTLLDKDNKK